MNIVVLHRFKRISSIKFIIFYNFFFKIVLCSKRATRFTLKLGRESEHACMPWEGKR